MLRVDGRSLSLSEALSSVLQGDLVPIEESSKPVLNRALRPSKKPNGLTRVAWLSDVLHEKGGVLAAIPETEGAPGTTVALDDRVAGGHAGFWAARLLKGQAIFAGEKTRCAGKRSCYESILLNKAVPEFLPDGDSFGLAVDATDALLEAGVSVSVSRSPYAEAGEKKVASCATEVALQLAAAERGVAPAVFAAFLVSASCGAHWAEYTRPAQPVRGDAPLAEPAQPEALVTIGQVHSFSLGDLMHELRSERMPARKQHLRSVLAGACGDVFACVRRLSRCADGFAIVKLSMTPASVAFSPHLEAGSDGWTLHGHGYMPVGDQFVDGKPLLTDFSTPFCFSVREASHSFEAAYLLHSLLLVSFARAQHGAAVADVLLEHLLSEGDPAGFVAAARAVESRGTNVSAFLAALAANSDMREQPDVSKALSGVVSDLDRIVRARVVGSDGALSGDADFAPFNKVVCMLCNSSNADTRIFARDAADADDVELEHLHALEQLQLESIRDIQASLQASECW